MCVKYLWRGQKAEENGCVRDGHVVESQNENELKTNE